MKICFVSLPMGAFGLILYIRQLSNEALLEMDMIKVSELLKLSGFILIVQGLDENAIFS